MARICFLFNHDQGHQVAHSLPVAAALAKTGMHEVVLAASNAAIASALSAHCVAAEANLAVVILGLNRRSSKTAAALLDGVLPARKLLLYRDNLDFFRSFDAIVVSEQSSLLLKTRYGLPVPIIYTSHGAGDRAIGFDRKTALFDLVLAAGPKIRDRWIADAGVAPERIAITGYAKFDACAGNRADVEFGQPERQTVLYNPHPSPHLSSWYRDGATILEAFYRQSRYNLIFAPHVMLFTRGWTVTIDRLTLARVKPPHPKYAEAPHIHIDLGSPASSDMSYTNSADVYLGDASSQIYEFLAKPRPALFLNSHRLKWRGDANFNHWQTGPVIEDASAIIDAVDRAIATHGDYRPVQKRLFDYTFSRIAEPAAERSACAIDQYLQASTAR